MEPKELHDRLLSDRPEGAIHNSEACPICTPGSVVPTSASAKEDAVSEITKEQLEAAVASATAEANARITELEAQVKAFAESQHQEAIDTAVAEAQAEAQAKIDELQVQLDAAVLEANTHKEAFEKFQSELVELTEAENAAKELEAKRDERVAKVAEVASFPEEHVQANAERWARMSEEDFESQLNDWRAIAAKSAGDGVPNTTSLQANRDNDNKPMTATQKAFAYMRAGADSRTI